MRHSHRSSNRHPAQNRRSHHVRSGTGRRPSDRHEEPASRADRGYLPTHGSYYWHETSQRAPGDCTCTCCPHSYAGARRASAPDGEYRYEPAPRHRDSSRRNSHAGAPPAPRRSPPRPTSVLVENKTHGTLRRQHGEAFRLAIPHDMTTKDILSFLAPDSRRYRVVVHWDDFTTETLRESIGVAEIRQYTAYLEVKERKRVHWA